MCFSWFKVFLLAFNCRWASWHVRGGGARESAEPRGPTAAGEQRQTADHVQGVDPVQVPQSAGTAARDTGLRSRAVTRRRSDADRDPVWPELHPQPKLAAHTQAVLVLVLAFGTEQLSIRTVMKRMRIHCYVRRKQPFTVSSAIFFNELRMESYPGVAAIFASTEC